MRADPDELFRDRFDDRPAISAEAASGSPRGPSYDELWRRRRFEAPAPTSPRKSTSAPLFGAIVAILIGVMGLIGLRDKIVRLAPVTARAYAAIGLPINIAGLEFQGVHSKVVMEGTRKVLSVEGEILNLRRDSNSLPPLAVAVRGADGQDVYSWTTRAPKAKLERGEKVAFRARLAAPPENGAEVLVRFATAEEAARDKAPAK
jgi:hypothetical protein